MSLQFVFGNSGSVDNIEACFLQCKLSLELIGKLLFKLIR